jgi:hypothetical protein
MVKLATPNGIKRDIKLYILSSEGTKKNESRVMGSVEPHVGKTRYGTPLIQVGCSVIAARYSEKHLTNVEHD